MVLLIWHQRQCTCGAFVRDRQPKEDAQADLIALDLSEPQFDLVRPG
jgi:hypothetical protein